MLPLALPYIMDTDTIAFCVSLVLVVKLIIQSPELNVEIIAPKGRSTELRAAAGNAP